MVCGRRSAAHSSARRRSAALSNARRRSVLRLSFTRRIVSRSSISRKALMCFQILGMGATKCASRAGTASVNSKPAARRPTRVMATSTTCQTATRVTLATSASPTQARCSVSERDNQRRRTQRCNCYRCARLVLTSWLGNQIAAICLCRCGWTRA